MMLRLLLLFFPFLLIAAEKGPAPDWVTSYEFPLEKIDLKPSQKSLQYLLVDTQTNTIEKTLYYHEAIRILTQSGAEEFSQLSINFNPAYYQIVMHSIRVFRDGVSSDRLENARCETLQRETDLESNLFFGNFTLVYFLEDIREGDIVEYSYSEIGEHPLLTNHHADAISLQKNPSIERIVHRLLAPTSSDFTIKSFNTDIEPQICDLSNSTREWVWEACNTSSDTLCLSDRPEWYNPRARVHISTFKSWNDVAQVCSKLHVLPGTFSHEIETIVDEWKNTSSDPYKRALLALRFVQDNIRYFGVEEGIGAVRPTDPSAVIDRRSGDCKDKTFLLHALLSLMDISSTPLLVSSKNGKRLPEVLPMPFVFDHEILQIDIDGDLFWVDSTASLQGGSLKTNFCPNYEWGLLLSPKTEALTPFPNNLEDKPLEITTSITSESQDEASLKITTILHGSNANGLRNYLESAGTDHLGDQRLTYMQEAYGAVSLTTSLDVVDDREQNIMFMSESYLVPTQKLKDRKVLEVLSFILNDYLPPKTSPMRVAPYAIPYPHWIKESIHIENPFTSWTPSEEIYIQEHESLIYSLFSNTEEHKASFEVELKHLKDHVPQASCQEYWNIIKDINWKSLPRVTVANH